MLINTKTVYGTKLTAKDGPIGHVRDFYFDDKTWVIRYVVADTGSWLTGRQVLLSPHAFGHIVGGEKALHVKLNIKQIESSPSIESHKPVSRQFEEEYHSFYSWPGYWQGPDVWGMTSYPMVVPPSELVAERTRYASSDTHLQSAIAVAGFHIEAVDGTIGHVTGFLFDRKTWGIRDLVVEAGSWYAGKEVRVSSAEVTRISYEESKVYVTLTKASIQRTGEEELVRAGPSAEGHKVYSD